MNKRFVIPGVAADTPLGDAARALLLAKAEPLFELEEAARSGADADAVHDMRVASRRLREALRLVRPLYPDKPFRKWYRRIRRITRALGPVRDSDVFIEAFSRLSGTVGAEGRRAIAWAVGYRQGQRIHELDVLDRVLASLDLDRSRAAFARFARGVRDCPEARQPFASFAHAAIAERAAAAFGRQDLALDERNIAEQHALRIDYKRLRYAVEAFAPCYAEEFDELHKTLTAFQDALGELHDAHVFIEMLTAPDRVEAAARAGVSERSLAAVRSVLEEQAHVQYARFVELVEQHPPQELLPRLLLPLANPHANRADESADGSRNVPAAEPRATRGEREEELPPSPPLETPEG